MEAKDTVMEAEEIRAIHHYWNGLSDDGVKRVKLIAIAQAEISFKAGMKEVVEWIRTNGERVECRSCRTNIVNATMIILDKWWAKLEEWGLK